MSKNLKKIIKEMVRESLVEIFAEMKLESLIESAVAKQSKSIVESHEQTKLKPSKQGSVHQEQPQLQKQDIKKIYKENLISKMGVSEDEWKNIYEDVNIEKLPPSISSGAENPEFVSENDLKSLGLL